jgi:chemotaxis protein CheX
LLGRGAPDAGSFKRKTPIRYELAITEERIMSENGSPAKAVTQEELIACLERALKEITTTMFNCESIIIPMDQVDIIPPGLSAVVGFGGKICGFVALHLAPSSACTLASGLLGMHFEEMDDIVADAMGEMVNMLAGGLKKYASKNEDLFKISVPSIVYGMDYATHSPKNAEHLTLGVETGSCTFSVQLVYAHR